LGEFAFWELTGDAVADTNKGTLVALDNLWRNPMKCGVLLVFGLAVCLMGLTGCETISDTPGENFNRVAHTVDTDGKLLPIDAERLALIYKPTILTPDAVPNR